MMKKGFTNRRGFSLAEAMIAALVLGAAVSGVIIPFSSGAAVRAEGMHRTLGAKLASDLMEQIINTPFDDVITNYNYIEDQGQVKDAGGVVFGDSNYANFSRQVSSDYVYVPQESGKADSNFILATVSVYYKDREIAIISRLIGK